MIEFSCLPVLIGSLPIKNHLEALQMIMAHTPQIPLWPQLPKLPKEGMVQQFMDGFPGLTEQGNAISVNTSTDDFVHEMAAFYQDFLGAQDLSVLPDNSRFSLDIERAKGFFILHEHLNNNNTPLVSVKGQITGPMTTGISIKDQDGNSIFYDDNLRDMLTKLLALKARWQIERLKPLCDQTPPILFIDEPGMVSFGSTALAGVTREMVCSAVNEVIDEVRTAGGLAGIHICANGDWEPVLQSNTDIISFDAYSYFDNFILYRKQLVKFIERGGILAWGIIPTANPDIIKNESVENLFSIWESQLARLTKMGIPKNRLLKQTIIAPSCGTGSLTIKQATKVLSMTASLSSAIRKHYKSNLSSQND